MNFRKHLSMEMPCVLIPGLCLLYLDSPLTVISICLHAATTEKSNDAHAATIHFHKEIIMMQLNFGKTDNENGKNSI